MADFTKNSAADIAADNPGVNMGTTGTMHELDWDSEDAYWQSAYPERPYASADRSYAYYRDAYRFGAEAAKRHSGREWNDVEHDLRGEWPAGRESATSTWEEMKAAVRDAWDHVRGRSTDDRTHIR